MELDELKIYLRIDCTEDDALIGALQTAAEEYLSNAGILKDYDKNLYKLAVELLVANWYENRAAQSEKSLSKISFGLDTIINQLYFSQATT